VEDADQAAEALQDPLHPGEGEARGVDRAHHSHEVVEDEHAERLVHARELALQPADAEAGRHVEEPLHGLGLELEGREELRHAREVRRHGQRTARRGHARRHPPRLQRGHHALVLREDDGHEAVLFRIGLLGIAQGCEAARVRSHGRRRVAMPADGDAPPARLGRHAELDPRAGEEGDTRQSGLGAHVGADPSPGIEVEVGCADAGITRQPGGVDDEGGHGRPALSLLHEALETRNAVRAGCLAHGSKPKAAARQGKRKGLTFGLKGIE